VSEAAPNVAFQTERLDRGVRVGMAALDQNGAVALAISCEIDLATARLWLAHLERAVGSGRARSFVRPA
jgi:hypothetical protein